MITENVSFNLTSNKALNLSHLAVPGTAKILIGTRWTSVDKYDIYGAPILPATLIKLFSMENEIAKACGSSYTIEVRYNHGNLIPPAILSNPDYVTYKLNSAIGFIDYLTEIKKYKKEFPYSSDFHEFIFYGKFWLNQYGSVMEMTELYDVPSNVMEAEEFKKIHPTFTLSPFPTDSIVNSELRCPCCLQHFTLNDILQDKINWRASGGPTHRDCQSNLYSLENKSDIFGAMHNAGWDISNYTEIPNEYGCDCEICKNHPWFIFHTFDGDIKIGWRKHVISIEFMDGFSEFPMSIFKKENVTKWEKGIHAWGTQKATEYLAKVHNYLH